MQRNVQPTNNETDVIFEHSYFDATVQEIAQTVETDVDMTGPAAEPQFFLVLDTNVLLSNLDVIRQFTADIEKQSAPLLIVIPAAVLSELDAQKNRQDLAWFARRASTWILERVKERKSVKGQTQEEQYDKTRPNVDPDRKNDLSILDCCLYYAKVRRLPGFLASGDKNLCIEAESRDVPTIQPGSNWSSLDIAKRLFPRYEHLSLFARDLRPYRPGSKLGSQLSAHVRAPSAATSAVAEDDGMSMDVDDDSEAVAEALEPQHALDSLHLQVIDHFLTLLANLVLRNADASELQGRASSDRSRYAPEYSTRPFSRWTAADCVEYLESKKRLPGAVSVPKLEVFCLRPYGGRGARRGQDWTKRDWDVALGDLGRIGDQWGEGAFRESLSVLRPHLEYVFSMRMKPTGM